MKQRVEYVQMEIIKELMHSWNKWRTDNKLPKETQTKLYINATNYWLLEGMFKDFFMTMHIIEMDMSPNHPGFTWEKYNANIQR